MMMESTMLPFELLPSQELIITKKKKKMKTNTLWKSGGGGGGGQEITNSGLLPISTSPPLVNWGKLDDTSAETLLKFIKDNDLEKKSIKKHQVKSSSSSLPLHIAKSLPPPTQSNPGDHQIAHFFGIVTKDMVANMRKSDLMEYRLTLRILIQDCAIPIANLHKAGILRTFDDLVDLGFKVGDLTLDRTRFNVNHFVQLFNSNFDTLIKYRDIVAFDIYTLVKAGFHGWELQSLSFSFDEYIKHKFMTKRHFKEVIDGHKIPYTLTEMTSTLGLTNEGLERLKISPRDAKDYGWSVREFKSICNLK